MYEKTFALMFSIEEKNAVVTGGSNLDRLVWFMTGYAYAELEETGKQISFIHYFGEYALNQMRINVERARGWQYYLKKKYPSEPEAIKEFYRLLHTFYSDLSVGNIKY